MTMAGYDRNTSSSEEEEETKPNLRDIFRKPTGSSNREQVRKDTARIKDDPSTTRSSQNRGHSKGETLEDEYGTRKKTSRPTNVTSKIRNKDEPKKESTDDFMAIFGRPTSEDRPVKAGVRKSISPQRSASDDSEEDEEKQPVARHTPGSSVSSGSHDDPFKRLQASIKGDSEEDEGKNTATRQTPRSSVSSGSRSYQSKEKTESSPVDPFKRLQASIQGDSEEDEGKNTATRQTPRSSVSSGSRTYQSKEKTESSPVDPFKKLQASMKGNAQDKGSDKHGQSKSHYDNEESFSDSSRGSLSDNADDRTPDNPFKRLVESTKGTDHKTTQSFRSKKEETDSSSSDESDASVQSGEENNPFMKMVADVKTPKSKPVNSSSVNSSASKQPSRKPTEDSTSKSAGDFATRPPNFTSQRQFNDLPPSTPQSSQGGQNPMAQMQMLQQMLGGQAGQDPMAQLNMLQQMMGGQGGDMMNMLGQAGRGNPATSNPAFQTDKMFEGFPGMTNGAEGNFGAPNPSFTTESMFGDFSGMANGAGAEGDAATADADTTEATEKMFAEIQRLVATTQSDDPIPLLKAMIEPTLTEEEKIPVTIESLMAKPRGTEEEIPDDDTGIADAKPSVRLKEMEEDRKAGRGVWSGEFRPLNPRVGGPGGAQVGQEGIGGQNPMAQMLGGQGGQNPMDQMQMLQQMLGGQGGQNPMAQMLGGQGGQNPMAQMQMLQQMLGGQAGQDPMAQLNMLQQMMGGQGGDMMSMLGQAGRGRGRGMGMGRGSGLENGDEGSAPSNPMASLLGGQDQRSAGRGSAPSNQMAPLLGGRNTGGAGRGSSPANQISPLSGAQNRGGAGGQNPMAQMQMLQQMLGGQGGQNPMAQMQMLQQMLGGQGGQNPMAQMQMLQQMLGGQAGQDPMAQLNMLQQMMGGQGGDMMNMLGQAGRGRGRGMGMGRGSRVNWEDEDAEINIDDLSDNDIIRQMLEWEAMRAHSNKLQKDPNGMTTLLIVDISGSMAGDAMLQTEEFLDTFMDGLEHQQKNLNMHENVAVITVGSSVEVKQHLTNSYPKIREALYCLCAEGPSKLHFGLMLPMSILQLAENGGIKDFGGHAAAPRVILISDGRITGQPDGPTLPDEREKMALQNVTLELLNTMIQTTLTQVFCIPVGNSDKGFLEFISSTTPGGKTMDRKYARVLSRYHIYHTVVATLKQHQTEPTNESIRHQLVTVAQTYNEDDVAEVLYLWRQPEPDIQGRNQRLAQQEEESSRGRQGGMPGGGRQGQGRGGGVPGLGGFGGQSPGMGGLPPGMGPLGRGLGGFPPGGRGGLGGRGQFEDLQ